MAVYTCSMNADNFTIFNERTRKMLMLGQGLIMNALERRMEQEGFPKNMRGRSVAKILAPTEYATLCGKFNHDFAQCALNASTGDGFHDKEDIKRLSDEMVHNNDGVRNFVTNAVSALITPTFPAVTSNIFDLLCETRYGAIGDSFIFDLPSNEAYTWHEGARGSRSYTHDMREPNTLVLNPRPVGTTFDISYVRMARGEFNMAEEILALLLGKAAYDLGAFINILSEASANLTGSAYYAPSYSPDNFKRIKNNVAIANGNMGQVFCLGTEIALGKVLPDNTTGLYSFDERVARMGRLTTFANTPLVEIKNAFVPGTYAGLNPTRVFADDKLYFFATGGDKPIKQAIGGSMATVTRTAEQKSNKVTSYTVEIETAMGVVTGRRWGEIDGV